VKSEGLLSADGSRPLAAMGFFIFSSRYLRHDPCLYLKAAAPVLHLNSIREWRPGLENNNHYRAFTFDIA
jgi:hypothetical protein